MLPAWDQSQLPLAGVRRRVGRGAGEMHAAQDLALGRGFTGGAGQVGILQADGPPTAA
jgi:hypothetical protein